MTHSCFTLYTVVEGSVPEVTELLRYEWGTVMFTGSERVGRVSALSKSLVSTLPLAAYIFVSVLDCCISHGLDIDSHHSRTWWKVARPCG